MPGKKSFNIKKLSRQRLCAVAEELCAYIKTEGGEKGIPGVICPENLYLREDGSVAVRRATGEKPRKEEIDFLAPEVFWKGETGPLADIYSVGMLLYYGVSHGALPLEEEADAATARGRRLAGKPFSAPEAAGSYLGSVIEKATAFRPEDRFQSATELAAMLHRITAEKYTGSAALAAVLGKAEGQLSETELMLQRIMQGGTEETVEEEPEPPEEEAEPYGEPEAEIPAEHAEEQELPAESEPEPATEEPEAPGESAPEPAGEKPAEELFPEEALSAAPEVVAEKPLPAEREPYRDDSAVGEYLTEYPDNGNIVYTRNLSREKDLEKELRQRRRRPVVILCLLTAILLLVALAVNSYERANNLVYPAATAEPVVAVLETPVPELTPTPEPTATPEPVVEVEHRYEVFMEDVSWTEAKARCEAKGGHLVTINDQNEFQYVISLVEGNTKIEKVWIGCHRVDGNMVWENGVDITFYPWANGEPSVYDRGDGVAEDYVLMWYHNYGWYYNDSRDDPVKDYPEMYSGRIAYICEYGS